MTKNGIWWGRWARAFAATMTVLAVVFTWRAVSDGHTENDAPDYVPIATLDVERVFRQHAPFNEQMEQLKREILEFEEEYRKMAQSRLDEVDKSEVKRVEAEKAALALVVNAKRTDVLEREGRVYEEVFAKIETIVSRLCAQKNIGLVIHNDAMEKKLVKGDRAATYKAVSRVVVHSRAPDITEDVIKSLNSTEP